MKVKVWGSICSIFFFVSFSISRSTSKFILTFHFTKIRARQSFCKPITEPADEFPPEPFDVDSDKRKVEENIQQDKEEEKQIRKRGFFGSFFGLFKKQQEKTDEKDVVQIDIQHKQEELQQHQQEQERHQEIQQQLQQKVEDESGGKQSEQQNKWEESAACGALECETIWHWLQTHTQKKKVLKIRIFR